MRLKSALRRGVAAAVIAGIVVSSGIPAYAAPWNIADGDITVKGASDESGNYNNVKQGEKDFEKDEGETVITGESDKNTVTIDTSEGNVDVTFDDLKIDISGKKEGDGSGKTEVDGSGKTEGNVSDEIEGDVSGDSPVDAGKAAVTVQGDHAAANELDGANELKSGSCNAGLEKNGNESSGKLTIKDDNDTKGSLTAEGGEAGVPGHIEVEISDSTQQVTADDSFSLGGALGLSLLISCVIALIVCMVFRSQMNSVRTQTTANQYVGTGGLNLTLSRDIYRYTSQKRRQIPRNDNNNNSTGGGHGGAGFSGSISHTSSSGHGRSGKF